jgi:hypothetical protein
MSTHAGPITLDWVSVGGGAFGLVLDGRIVALLYWDNADVAELREPPGEPVVTDAGFSWVPADRPWEHFYLFDAPEPDYRDWQQARDKAAHAYFGWRGPSRVSA